MSNQLLYEDPQTKVSTYSSKGRKLQERHLHKFGVIRCDTSTGLRFLIDLEVIKQLPSGVCVYPYSNNEEKDKFVVCKDEEKIKIFKVQPNEKEPPETDQAILKPGEARIVSLSGDENCGRKPEFFVVQNVDGKHVLVERIGKEKTGNEEKTGVQ